MHRIRNATFRTLSGCRALACSLTLRECSGVGRPGRTFRFGLDLAPLLAQRGDSLERGTDPHNGDCTFAVDGRTITLHGHVEAVNPTSGKAGLRQSTGLAAQRQALLLTLRRR